LVLLLQLLLLLLRPPHLFSEALWDWHSIANGQSSCDCSSCWRELSSLQGV
jgi:hypothetical protein